MVRRLTLALLGLTFALPPAACQAQFDPPQCDDDQCIQVGSYNIELLGSARKPLGQVKRGQRSDAQLHRLAERMADTLDLEVVVLQEINTNSDEWARLRENLASAGYQFFAGTTSDRDQFVVLAWDADEVTLQGSPRELDVSDQFELSGGCREDGLRKPVAAQFKAGEFDFWVVGVHLKSRVGDEQCADRIRTRQCEELVEAIDKLIKDSGERDVLIVGDCNQRLNHVSFEPLTSAGFISQMRFLAAGSAQGSYVKTGSRHESDDLIDHVWLRYSDTNEVVRNSAFVMPLGSAAKATRYIIEQSDHVPVCVSFRIDFDLDEAEDDD